MPSDSRTQTILGADGVIGHELSKNLPQLSTRVRQVSRSPKRVNATDELFTADLLDAKATADAVTVDSSKVERALGLTATEYRDGIAAALQR